MSRFGDRSPIYKPDCLPGGQDALLGVIPLETPGLEPDLQHQQLRALPITPEQTYLSAV